MTIYDAAQRYSVCTGHARITTTPWTTTCPFLGDRLHWRGFIDPFGVAHFTDRRFTRRALRNLLLLVARRDRLADPGWLNDDKVFAYYYLWADNVTAAKMAMDLGVRLPARLSRLDRLRCTQLAKRAGVRLSKRSAVYAWSNDV